MQEEDNKEQQLPTSSFVDYDGMSDDDYYIEMERKVEYYKKHYPDMYSKAEKWLEMMNESQIYQANAPNDTEVNNPEKFKSSDLMKNALYNGWLPEDISDEHQQILTNWIPDWKEQLINNQ